MKEPNKKISEEQGKESSLVQKKANNNFRISGQSVDGNRLSHMALQDVVYGIGKTRSIAICKYLGIDQYSKVKDLSEEDIQRVNNFIDESKYFLVNDELRKYEQEKIREIKTIRIRRAIRRELSLPNTNNTRRNAKTHKNRRSSKKVQARSKK